MCFGYIMFKNHWIPRDAAFVPNGELNYDTSLKNDGKRSHQWFMDAIVDGSELLNNKRRAIEAVAGGTVQGSESVYPWDINSNLQSLSGQTADQLGGSEAMRFINLVDRHVASLNTSEICAGINFFNDQYGNEPSVSLSMSHGMNDPSLFLNFGGIRKVRVNEVRDPDNSLSAIVGDHYERGENGFIPMDAVYNKAHSSSMSLGTACHNRDGNRIHTDAGFCKIRENFMSLGDSFNKDDENFISMGPFGRGSENMLSMDRPFPKGDDQFITMDPTYAKGEANVMSVASAFNKDHSNFISMEANFGRVSDNFISVGSSYGKTGDNLIPMTRTYDKVGSDVMSNDATYQKGDPNTLLMGQRYGGEGNIISFRGFLGEQVMNAPVGMTGNYEFLLDKNNLRHTPEVPRQKNVDISSGQIVSNCSASMANTFAAKNKEQKTVKKPASNNFPSNVKSLLSTGMLDGVPVKYVSWSREKNLPGIINGSGYRCGCSDCNLSKSLNGYEFEHHAGCKTKHPNNHIYFENGKTVYAVVQELKNTPQELLFDAIQTATGSPINQKNYLAWKESYQAATLELQRIYGKPEIIMPS